MDVWNGLCLACSLDFCDIIPRGASLVSTFHGPLARRFVKEAKASQVDYMRGQCLLLHLGISMGKLYAALQTSRRKSELSKSDEI